ncbi:hypothetical protein EV702DRAFT_1088677 [Suillus placidus]|uniref:Uncharacterized protein n=1 Tax=Suillus placidus TaxID=48579 RepID=A0A9P6ZZ83_9AGAM|nr:hypothetical protein EV702DRAFT_1088677 [Suillus placidus]
MLIFFTVLSCVLVITVVSRMFIIHRRGRPRPYSSTYPSNQHVHFLTVVDRVLICVVLNRVLDSVCRFQCSFLQREPFAPFRRPAAVCWPSCYTGSGFSSSLSHARSYVSSGFLSYRPGQYSFSVLTPSSIALLSATCRAIRACVTL